MNAKGGQQGNALSVACDGGHAKLARMLIDHGVDVDSVDSTGRPPLYKALRQNNVTIVEILMRAKASNTIIDKQGCIALHHAASGACASALKQLVLNKAFLNAKDFVGWTPLHWAARNGSQQLNCFSMLELIRQFWMAADVSLAKSPYTSGTPA